MKYQLLLILLGLFTAISSKTNILVLPTVGSHRSIEPLASISKELFKNKALNIEIFVHKIDSTLWPEDVLFKTYGNSDEMSIALGTFEEKRDLAILTHLTKDSQFIEVKSKSIDAIICFVDDFPCKKIAKAYKIPKKILLINDCPIDWNEVFDRHPGKIGWIQRIKNLIVRLLLDLGFLQVDDRTLLYDEETLYFTQCYSGMLKAKPQYKNIYQIGTYFETKEPLYSDTLKAMFSISTKVIYVSLENLKDDEVQTLLKTFSDFNMITFIIRANNFNLDHYKLSNVKMQGSQSIVDIIGHEYCSMIITSNDWSSVALGIKYSKPILLLKTVYTEPTNEIIKQLILSDGIGLDKTNTKLTSVMLEESIREVIYNAQYSRRLKLYKERQQLLKNDTIALISTYLDIHAKSLSNEL